MSGLSLSKECFNYYDTMCRGVPKDLSIVFAPVLANENGIKNIEKLVESYGRKYNDFVLSAKKIPIWDNNNPILDANFLGINYPNEYITSIILPYMGPDTNSEFCFPVLEKFLYTPKAQKGPTENLDYDYGYI